MSHLYTIAPELPFANTLVDIIREQFLSSESDLAHLTLLLPNRRSCHTFQKTFLARNSNNATFLPKLIPLGDLGENVIHTQPIAPAMSRTQQKILLTTLVTQWTKELELSTTQSAELATELLYLLDEANEEECDLSKLRYIIPDSYSTHWQHTLAFLKILTQEWPRLLKKLNHSDPICYRSLTLYAQAEYWQKHPPTHPVIAAGSTGSIPATAHLLTTLTKLNNGYVILPGLDKDMPDDDWEIIDATHPQYGLKQLLSHMQIPRHEVCSWGPSTSHPRTQLMREVMLPAEHTHRWQHSAKLPAKSTKGIVRLDASSLQEEALAVALILRDTLTHPEKTAALVTHDRELARYVAALMEQWDITLDDSEGVAATQTVPAIFMRLLAEASLPHAAPLAILSFLKNPLCLGESSNTSFRYHVRLLEKSLFRGVRHHEGLASVAHYLKFNEMGPWFDEILTPLQPLIQLLQRKTIHFTHALSEHMKACEQLSSEIWKSDEGRQLKPLLDEILLHSDHIGTIAPSEYIPLLLSLLAGNNYRPTYGQTTRLAILSPLEARIQPFDIVILSGLNEGIWPGSLRQDPWMNHAMRQKIGLPPQERSIGLAAHDFAQLCSHHTVYLTRSCKRKGLQTIPSRWLMRLEQVMQIHQLHYDSSKPWLAWAKSWQYVNDHTPCTPPAPMPPTALRPQHYSASAIEQLMRNPYHIYAAHILRLKPLDPIDQDPGAAEFGNFIHQVLEAFHQDDYTISYDALIECAQNILQTLHLPQAITTLWWPRFKRIAHWIISQEQQRSWKMLHTEVKGQFTLDNITISARADRIEETEDGKLRIIDYKTGSTPSQNFIRLGISPQMIIEALIAQKDGFKTASTAISSLEYWRISGGTPPGELRHIKDFDDLCEQAITGLSDLCQLFIQAETPYLHSPRPYYAPSYDVYSHLSREKEWKK